MVDHLQQSTQDLEPGHCPDCRTEMLRYRSIVMSDTAPHTVAHFFQCPNCSRLKEKQTSAGVGQVSDPQLSLQPHNLSVHGAVVNEREDKAERYRAFAEQCLELIEQLPQDTHGRLTEMAAVWLELAQSELKAKSALTTPASIKG